MLSKAHRLRRSAHFDQVVRQGRRAASGTVVLHVLDVEPPAPTRVGFVVSKAVGRAATRNLVKRRLRHLARPIADEPGRLVVIRANPKAAGVDFETLSADLHRCLDRLAVTTS